MDAAAILTALESLPDEDLRGVIGRAHGLLASRADERQQQALAEALRIIRAANLDYELKKRRKRGRPPKRVPE